MEAPKSHTDAIAAHTRNDEEIQAAHTTASKTMLVTDKRFLAVTFGEQDDRDASRIESVSIDNVAGVDVDQLEDEDPSYLRMGAGAIAILAALRIGTVAASTLSDLLGVVVILAAVGIFAAGGWLAYTGFKTDDGHIKLSLFTTSRGANLSFKLPRSAEDFTAAVTKWAGASAMG